MMEIMPTWFAPQPWKVTITRSLALPHTREGSRILQRSGSRPHARRCIISYHKIFPSRDSGRHEKIGPAALRRSNHFTRCYHGLRTCCAYHSSLPAGRERGDKTSPLSSWERNSGCGHGWYQRKLGAPETRVCEQLDSSDCR